MSGYTHTYTAVYRIHSQIDCREIYRYLYNIKLNPVYSNVMQDIQHSLDIINDRQITLQK